MAGIGTDAQPLFRIFNPVAQGERFDPNGEYIRRCVPELANVPAKFIHQPRKMSRADQEAAGCVIGRDYPAPIVDHRVQRVRVLHIYRQEQSGVEANSITDCSGSDGTATPDRPDQE